MKPIWIIVITAIVAGGIGAGGSYYLVNLRESKLKGELADQITQLQKDLRQASSSQTSSTNSSQRAVAGETSNRSADLNGAKELTSNFLAAKKQRSLTEAKPYMTADFYSSTDQVEFAGTSNPHVNRYSIISAVYLENADLYSVKARVYQATGEEEIGYNDNDYLIVKEANGSLLINEEKAGAWVEI